MSCSRDTKISPVLAIKQDFFARAINRGAFHEEGNLIFLSQYTQTLIEQRGVQSLNLNHVFYRCDVTTGRR